MDFDPFESEEEFVLEESEQLSAIDEEVYLGLVDKVVYEGFSDVDSDALAAIETQDNLVDDSECAAGPPLPGSVEGRSRRLKNQNHGVSKKRKREGTEQDVI